MGHLRPIVLVSLLILAGPARLFGRQDAQQPPPTTPEVVVTASEYKQDAPVGPYNQPVWTTRRRFPATRVYLQTLPGEAAFEQWLEVRVPKDKDDDRVTRLREEFEFGLGSRTQLDLYVNTQHVRAGDESTFDFRGWSAEIRYALGDWDEIPANPTLYFEYHFNNEENDSIEPKLLLGGNVGPGVMWGVNLIYERTLGGETNRTEEISMTGSLGWAVIDSKLSIGPTVAATYESEDVDGEGNLTREILIGPSLQWIPVPRAHLDLEPLFGVTGESLRMKMFIVFGWQF